MRKEYIIRFTIPMLPVNLPKRLLYPIDYFTLKRIAPRYIMRALLKSGIQQFYLLQGYIRWISLNY